jgi:hypothetical protein
MTTVDLTTGGIARAAQVSDALVDVAPMSSLEALASELGEVRTATIALRVESRPGWAVVFSAGVEGAQMAAWRRSALDDTIDPPTVDEFLFHRIFVAAQCIGMHHNGVPVTDNAGKAVTFYSADLWRLLGIPEGVPSGATLAVKKFYANDYAVAAVSERVLEEAGFGRKVEVESPTIGLSAS